MTSDLFEGQASEELVEVEGGGFGGSGVSAGVRQLYDLGGSDGRSQTEALEQLRGRTAAGRGPRRDADVGRVLLLRLVTHCRRQERQFTLRGTFILTLMHLDDYVTIKQLLIGRDCNNVTPVAVRTVSVVLLSCRRIVG